MLVDSESYFFNISLPEIIVLRILKWSDEAKRKTVYLASGIKRRTMGCLLRFI